ncbi:MAG TPA: hypothetical protein DDY57_14770 [Franconibacter pulveris]|nr:hypothetical protein [Franconibacter pulveris]
MNRRFFFVKRCFNLFYCYLFCRHSINGGNVIRVETVFRKFEAGGVSRKRLTLNDQRIRFLTRCGRPEYNVVIVQRTWRFAQ